MTTVKALNQRLSHMPVSDDISPSRHQAVLFFRSLTDIPRQKYLYEKSLVFVLSGTKRGYLNEQILKYDQDNILLMSTDLAFDCEGFIDKNDRLQGIIIRLDIPLIQYMLTNLNQIKFHRPHDLTIGATTINFSQDIKEALGRLLSALSDDFQTDFLADGIIREILFHIMQSPKAAILSNYANHGGDFSRVCRSINFIHEHLSDLDNVDALAKMANMSASTFYRAFKKVTGQTPVQYIKNIRLLKAKELIEKQQWNVGLAASEVGYQNFSQFSREFRRQYGISPSHLKPSAMTL